MNRREIHWAKVCKLMGERARPLPIDQFVTEEPLATLLIRKGVRQHKHKVRMILLKAFGKCNIKFPKATRKGINNRRINYGR